MPYAKEKPTKPGIYWLKDYKYLRDGLEYSGQYPIIVIAVNRLDQAGVSIFNYGRGEELTILEGEFSGPIEPEPEVFNPPESVISDMRAMACLFGGTIPKPEPEPEKVTIHIVGGPYDGCRIAVNSEYLASDLEVKLHYPGGSERIGSLRLSRKLGRNLMEYVFQE